MMRIRAVALTCFAANAFETATQSATQDAVSLLQTRADKKSSQGPNMKELQLGPPWVDVKASDFHNMVSEGMGMLHREALELDLHEKEAQGEVQDGMRFPLAGKHDGHDVDLIVSAAEGKKYNSGKLVEKKGEANGLHNGFSRVFIKAGTSQQFKLKVVKTGTQDVVKVPLLAVSFFALGAQGRKLNWATSVSDCNEDLVSEYWKGPSVNEVNETGCGGLSFQGAAKLLPRGRSEPASAAEVDDAHCPGSLVLKWFDAEEITLELTAGTPGNRKAIPFLFKVGLTKCDVTWEPPVIETRAEKKARIAEEKAAEKAAAQAEKDAQKAAEKAARDAERAAARAAKR